MGTAMRDDNLTVQQAMPGTGRAGFTTCEVINVDDFAKNNRDWSKQQMNR